MPTRQGAFEAEGAFRCGHSPAGREPSPPGLRAESLCPDIPNKQQKSEQLGTGPPTTISDNDESLMLSPRFTKEQ